MNAHGGPAQAAWEATLPLRMAGAGALGLALVLLVPAALLGRRAQGIG